MKFGNSSIKAFDGFVTMASSFIVGSDSVGNANVFVFALIWLKFRMLDKFEMLIKK